MQEKLKRKSSLIQEANSNYVKRSSKDRRSFQDRRVLDMGPGYPGKDRRIHKKDRRRGWEDRYGWERTSKWSSSPIFSDLP